MHPDSDPSMHKEDQTPFVFMVRIDRELIDIQDDPVAYVRNEIIRQARRIKLV